MSEVKVGTPVKFKHGDTLVRKSGFIESGKRTWMKVRDGPNPNRSGYLTEEFLNTPRTGLIIGQRTLSNGVYRSWDGEWDDEPGIYQVTETFQAYLVVESLHSAPVKIRVEDVEIVEKGPGP